MPSVGRVPKKRVAVVSFNYGLVGGAETYTYEVTERLAESGRFDIHVFASRFQQGSPKIQFHRIATPIFPRWLRPLTFAWLAGIAIRDCDVDIIHSHDRLFEYDVLTHHGLPHELWVRDIRKKKRMSFFDKATASIEKKGIQNAKSPTILSVSTIGKRAIQQHFNIPEERIRVLHPGISTNRFDQLTKDRCRHDVRSQHNIHMEDLVLLFVGMNFEIKGLGRILEGLSVLAETRKEHDLPKLLVVGKGNERKYKRMAEQLGIGDNVVFTGVIEDVERYYLASDIFILMSYMDVFGIVVLEAMASELPVVITDTVGACDVVENGVNGFVVNGNNYKKGVVECLSALMSKAGREEMGKAGRKTAELHDWSRIVEQVTNVYYERFGT